MGGKVAFIERLDYHTELVEDAVEQLFCLMPSVQSINEQTKILLKPNLLAKHPPEHAVTTHPEVIRATIRACINRGAKLENIIIADSAGGLYHPNQMKSLYQGTGLAQMAKEEHVSLYTECESSLCPTKDGKVVTEFEILKPVLEADYIINLPKLKSHVMTGMTAACKNMFGVIPGLKKSEWHMRFPDKERFGHMLIDLLETIPPDLAILDGILGMEGDGPAGGNPRIVGVLMASEDMVNMDLAIAHMMGLDPMVVPYLKAAHERGFGQAAFNMDDVLGEKEAFRKIEDWKLPKSYEGNKEGYVDFAEHLPSIIRPLVSKVEGRIAPRPIIMKSQCIGCKKCAEICSKDAIIFRNQKGIIQKNKCIKCFCCHEVCPVKAIEVKSLRLFQL